MAIVLAGALWAGTHGHSGADVRRAGASDRAHDHVPGVPRPVRRGVGLAGRQRNSHRDRRGGWPRASRATRSATTSSRRLGHDLLLRPHRRGFAGLVWVLPVVGVRGRRGRHRVRVPALAKVGRLDARHEAGRPPRPRRARRARGAAFVPRALARGSRARAGRRRPRATHDYEVLKQDYEAPARVGGASGRRRQGRARGVSPAGDAGADRADRGRSGGVRARLRLRRGADGWAPGTRRLDHRRDHEDGTASATPNASIKRRPTRPAPSAATRAFSPTPRATSSR